MSDNIIPLHANRDPRTYVDGATGYRPRSPMAPRDTMSRPQMGGERKKFVAKGHDSQLQEAQFDKHPVEITTTGGEVVHGTIARRDKWTITMTIAEGMSDAGCDLIIYKSAIESVLIRKKPAVTPAVQPETMQ